MARTKIAILASGSGTTTEAFIEATATGDVDGDIVLVIANKKDAGVFDRIKKLEKKYKLNIKNVHVGKKNYPAAKNEEVEYGRQTAAEEQAILKELEEADVDLVLLLGYMKLIGKSIVDKYGWREDYHSIYQGRMINNHPGLLPATKGLYGVHVQEKVLKDTSEAGHSLFIVDSKYDDGPVIAYHKVVIMPSDTPEVLLERVKRSEKSHLAADINKFIVEQNKYIGLNQSNE